MSKDKNTFLFSICSLFVNSLLQRELKQSVRNVINILAKVKRKHFIFNCKKYILSQFILYLFSKISFSSFTKFFFCGNHTSCAKGLCLTLHSGITVNVCQFTLLVPCVELMQGKSPNLSAFTPGLYFLLKNIV